MAVRGVHVHHRPEPRAAPMAPTINIELDMPNTVVTFGTLRLDVIEKLTGKPLDQWFGNVLVSTEAGHHGSRCCHTLQFADGEGFEAPGFLALRNEGGQIKLAVPLTYASLVGPKLGIDGRVRGSLAEYTIPVDGRRLVEFDTPLGPVLIRANTEGVRTR